MALTDAARDWFAEEIAWWRFTETRDSTGLIQTAVRSLLEGSDIDAVAELAGMEPDANPFEVDAILDRIIDELRLEAALEHPLDLIAARSLCRRFLAGDVTARALTEWAHHCGGHTSESTEIQRLAMLDDELDRSDNCRRTTEIERDIAAVAARIVALEI